MKKQNQQTPQQKDPQQQQNASQRGENPDQQGGQKPQGQPGAIQDRKDSQARANRIKTLEAAAHGKARSGANLHSTGLGSTDEDGESPEMNQAGEQSSAESCGRVRGHPVWNQQFLEDGSANQSAPRVF